VGSRVVMAAFAKPAPQLRDREWWEKHGRQEQGPFRSIRVVAPGILVLSGPDFGGSESERGQDELLENLADLFQPEHPAREFPLWIITEKAEYLEDQWENFLWVTFTRSDPATDIYGVESYLKNKHWGCLGPLVIDARLKPHHAPVLEEDPELVRRVESLAAPGGPLNGIF
jgi:4-hydroxy-3-polyprenylbenzoate decarboxylase